MSASASGGIIMINAEAYPSVDGLVKKEEVGCSVDVVIGRLQERLRCVFLVDRHDPLDYVA